MGTVRIRITSILGGHAKTLYTAAPNEFQSSLGINPGISATQLNTGGEVGVSGVLRPTAVRDLTAGVIPKPPMWFVKNPKSTSLPNPLYVYCMNGSVFTLSAAGAVVALSDTGLMSSATGNGAAYYDNYLYLAKNTDIARFGPLDGAPTFNGSYWQSTLGFSALNNTSYPTPYLGAGTMPNHVMHRHSDGKLYVADVQNNQGVIHMISTSKTTTEGDTNAGSKQSTLQFGYGLWPTAIESYGSQLVIALYESASGVNMGSLPAKIAFWDTTSGAFNQITWDEFPDTFISAIKNINGVLYFISNAGLTGHGFRVTRYVGGYSFQEVAFIEDGSFPYPGAVDGNTNQLVMGANNSQIFGSSTNGLPCVWSIGLAKNIAPNKIFNILRTSSGDSITALKFNQSDANNQNFMVGWSTFVNTAINGIDVVGSVNSGTNQNSIWWSQRYQIGQRFQVKQITVPLVNQLNSGQTITPTLYFDNKHHSLALPAINLALMTAQGATNLAVIKVPAGNNYGETEFWLELVWSCTATTANSAVKMPIVIDLETIDS